MADTSFKEQTSKNVDTTFNFEQTSVCWAGMNWMKLPNFRSGNDDSFNATDLATFFKFGIKYMLCLQDCS